MTGATKPSGPTIRLDYRPRDEARALRASVALPAKWVRPGTTTTVGRVLDVFAKTYAARRNDGELKKHALALVDPVSRRAVSEPRGAFKVHFLRAQRVARASS